MPPRAFCWSVTESIYTPNTHCCQYWLEGSFTDFHTGVSLLHLAGAFRALGFFTCWGTAVRSWKFSGLFIDLRCHIFFPLKKKNSTKFYHSVVQGLTEVSWLSTDFSSDANPLWVGLLLFTKFSMEYKDQDPKVHNKPRKYPQPSGQSKGAFRKVSFSKVCYMPLKA